MKEDLNYIGIIVKQIRKNKKMSQQSVGHIVGVDQATISRIEKGNKNITLSVYELVINFFNLSMDKNYQENYQLMFEEFIYEFENFQTKKIKRIYHKLNLKKMIYYKDYHLYLLLTSFCLLANNELNKINVQIDQIKALEHKYQGIFKKYFDHFLGLYYFSNEQFEQASIYYEQAYIYCERNKTNEGLLYYHYAWNQYLCLKLTTCILTIEKASSYFNKRNNQMRLMSIANLIGMIHLNDGNYEEAKLIFLDCFRNKAFLSLYNNKYIIMRNLALTYFYIQNYSESIKILKSLYQNKDYRTKTVVFFLLLILKHTDDPKFLYYFHDCQKINLPFIDKIITIFSQDRLQMFNASSFKEFETLISPYHHYSFVKWIIEYTSDDIYNLRKYSAYKILFDKFLELRVY